MSTVPDILSRPPNGRKPVDALPWSDFFAQELYLHNSRAYETIIHHAYLTPPLEKSPLFVTHHGAGSSGLSFAMFNSEIRKALPNCGVLSIDARGHGETVVKSIDPSTESGPLNLSLDILSQDLLDIIRLTQKKLSWPELPNIMLLGHSLGGAIVTDLAASGKLGNAVLGYAVFDVVEGSAIDALQSMQSYLSTRPKRFPSLAAGIEWQSVSSNSCIMVCHFLTSSVRVPERFAAPRRHVYRYHPFSVKKLRQNPTRTMTDLGPGGLI